MQAETIAATRNLHSRLGHVGHQPVSVTSFTNKRFTVNFRLPLDQLRRLLPPRIEPDPIGDTGQGMLSMCACDFWVLKLGLLPIPPIRNNDMLCRISARIRKRGRTWRAYYTLRSDSSSVLLGTLGSRFSHFRKRISRFSRIDDGRKYRLDCRARDPLCGGWLEAEMGSITKTPPASSVFADAEEATDFVFRLDGSCGYRFEDDRLSFQRIDYPDWDISFCHRFRYGFALIDHVAETFGLDLELDSTLFMERTFQVWGRSWLYRDEEGPSADLARRLLPRAAAM